MFLCQFPFSKSHYLLEPTVHRRDVQHPVVQHERWLQRVSYEGDKKVCDLPQMKAPPDLWAIATESVI